MKNTRLVPPRKSKVSRQGQITIPSAIRKAYGIEAGYEILFFPRENGRLEIRIQPPPHLSKHHRRTSQIDEERRASVREIKEDLERESNSGRRTGT